MKESGKMTRSMGKVRNKWFIELFLLILTLFNAFIGKMFFNAESRYEGEWKDDKRNGYGKK